MLKALFLAAGLVPGSLLVAAPVTLGFNPVSQLVFEGHDVNFDVVVSGLAAGGPPSVGSFDLTILYDPARLFPPMVTFGNFLGDPDTEALTAAVQSEGSIELAEVSLLTPAQLDALQPGSFSLATLSFIAASSGEVSLSFRAGIVDDAFGRKLVVIPEPATLLLIMPALLMMGRMLRMSL